MKKRLFALCLALLFILPTIMVNAESPNVTSLEAPQDVSVYEDNGEIYVRWTVPESIIDLAEELDGSGNDIFYGIDWKVNDGPWHYGNPVFDENTYDWDRDVDLCFTDYVYVSRENNVQDRGLSYWAFGLEDDYDLTKDKYTFRMRYAYMDYYYEGGGYVTSPWSNEDSIGGGIEVNPPTTLEKPTNLKAEQKFDDNGAPYFYLTWQNPASVTEINKSFPIGVKIDFKVGDGQWHSVKEGHEWWSAELYGTSVDFDPIEKQFVDSIVIEENIYSFRACYAYEPVTGPRVVSDFSNIVQIGTPRYESASNWAIPEMDQAAELGLITDKIKGKMNGPITREEFAEVAVKFYEMVTGKIAEPDQTRNFLDCSNPEVLKALNLGITSGVGDGTKFEPNSYLLRQQMAAMIIRTLKACYPDLEFDTSGQPDFTDQIDFAAYAIEPAKFMAKYKITVVDEKGNYNPDQNCTREQAVAFLLRSYLNKDQYLP